MPVYTYVYYDPKWIPSLMVRATKEYADANAANVLMSKGWNEKLTFELQTDYAVDPIKKIGSIKRINQEFSSEEEAKQAFLSFDRQDTNYLLVKLEGDKKQGPNLTPISPTNIISISTITESQQLKLQDIPTKVENAKPKFDLDQAIEERKKVVQMQQNVEKLKIANLQTNVIASPIYFVLEFDHTKGFMKNSTKAEKAQQSILEKGWDGKKGKRVTQSTPDQEKSVLLQNLKELPRARDTDYLLLRINATPSQLKTMINDGNIDKKMILSSEIISEKTHTLLAKSSFLQSQQPPPRDPNLKEGKEEKEKKKPKSP